MTAPTITLYVSIPLTLRVDDQESMATAAQLLPYDAQWDQASLDTMTPEALRQTNHARMAAAAKPIAQAIAGALQRVRVPGASVAKIGHVNISDQPPSRE
jgi:hypothetical protein